jgi:hypothetical protein
MACYFLRQRAVEKVLPHFAVSFSAPALTEWPHSQNLAVLYCSTWLRALLSPASVPIRVPPSLSDAFQRLPHVSYFHSPL